MSAAEQDLGVSFRPMHEGDVPVVLAVEIAAYDHPWTEGIFRDCLRVGYSCWVAETRAGIVGHGVMSVAAGECHILNLCVHPSAQRQRLGRKLLRRLLYLARARGADTAFLEVRESNRAARALYASEDFCEVGIRRGYYPATKGREDAVVLARAL